MITGFVVPGMILASAPSAAVVFRSDGSEQNKGFVLKWEAVGKLGLLGG